MRIVALAANFSTRKIRILTTSFEYEQACYFFKFVTSLLEDR